jgi:hypothetical protein
MHKCHIYLNLVFQSIRGMSKNINGMFYTTRLTLMTSSIQHLIDELIIGHST